MPGLPPLIERLRSPEAYPHAVVTPLRVAETHISWVVLTGAIAYKIKKPVRLSFLDYSTLERRRFCCEEELRLNARHAPDLYLGVSAISGTTDAPRVDGAGTAIEYAVRMRQFDPRDELDSLIAAGRVESADLEALGARVARVHSQSACADPAGESGRPTTVRRVITDNFAEIARLPEAAAFTDRLETLRRFVLATGERLDPHIERRRAEGRVRECHGDLHCGNVVRWQGGLVAFDGIEFDPGLRFVDVASDVAFLSMDLARHGRADLRRAFLQSWAESSGDFDGLRLLPCFETYRALVRAKVTALRALQEPGGSAERARDGALAAGYLDWAVQRARRGPGRLLLTCGLSGSGKSSLARRIAGPLLAIHLRSDVERKRLAGLGPLDDSRSPADGGIYTLEFTRRTYGRLHDCAEAALQGGETVVVDAAFLKRDERSRMLDLARSHRAPAAILHCVAPTDVLRARLEERSRHGTDASEAGVSILERQPAYWQEFGPDERPAVITVDTTAAGAGDGVLAELRSRGFD